MIIKKDYLNQYNAVEKKRKKKERSFESKPELHIDWMF